MTRSSKSQSIVDVAVFRKMLKQLGSDFENLHASHEHFRALVATSGSTSATSHMKSETLATSDLLKHEQPHRPSEIPCRQEDLEVPAPDEWSAREFGSNTDGRTLDSGVQRTKSIENSQKTSDSRGIQIGRPTLKNRLVATQATNIKFEVSLNSRDSSNSPSEPGSPISIPASPRPARATSPGSVSVAETKTESHSGAGTPGSGMLHVRSKVSAFSAGSGPRGESLERQGNRVKQELIAIFNQLDLLSTGCVETYMLRNSLVQAGLRPARSQMLLHLADPTNSGTIAVDKWVHVVTNADDREMHKLALCLREHLDQDGGLLALTDSRRLCMMHPLSVSRVLWDCLVSFACLYIAIFMPFTTVWLNLIKGSVAESLTMVDRVLNFFFIIDILINFRTGFVNKDGELTMNWKKVAKHYMQGWFLFDVVSSLPTDEIPDNSSYEFEHLHLIKVLKLSKLLKVLRIMRPRNVDLYEFSVTLDDIAQSKVVQLIARKSRLFFYMFFLCHWMACGMKLVDSGWLTAQENNVSGNLLSEYLCAQYWAMMTLTTVGYGDITPSTDAERFYTTVAMVVGACFYGYVVGAITAVVSKSDLNASVYHERMDLIYAWLKHHHLPIAMRRTLRRYFKAYLLEQSAVSEATVFQDLSHELQMEVGEYLIHEDVKNNPLFDGIGIGCVVQLQSVLKRVTIQAGYFVTIGGEMGIAMYVLVFGSLELIAWSQDEEHGEEIQRGVTLKSNHSSLARSAAPRSPAPRSPGHRQRRPLSSQFQPLSPPLIRELAPGESFGEEILLGFREHYEYTTKALEKCKLDMIPQNDFLRIFQTMPNILERIRRNALKSNPLWAQKSIRKSFY